MHLYCASNGIDTFLTLASKIQCLLSRPIPDVRIETNFVPSIYVKPDIHNIADQPTLVPLGTIRSGTAKAGTILSE